jgi:glutamine synthetase
MNPVILEYIWLDGNMELRSKYKTIYTDAEIDTINIPKWNYDGSSTNQATTDNSEIILNPASIYKNPFFQDNKAFLVLCDTYYEVNDKIHPTSTNNRFNAFNIFNKRKDMEPWYGIEQEYFMMRPFGTHDSNIPPFFTMNDHTKAQGDYYCGVGTQHIMYRELAEKHYKYCLYAGLNISGVNAEVAPNQWEYQIGPSIGIEAGDMLWVSRYILHKLSEEYNVNISFKPKPIMNPWNGSGLHTNFSTKATREEGGLDVINHYIQLLGTKHNDHIMVYGDNSMRLNGECETSDINTFSCGYGNRGCSIRIPKDTLKNGYGYFEDRRPASNADPYQVTSIIFQTCCL